MVRLYKPSQVITIEKIEAKEGKCDITIHLDLNLNLTGSSINIAEEKEEEKEKESPFEYTIPDFHLKKIKFGETVK